MTPAPRHAAETNDPIVALRTSELLALLSAAMNGGCGYGMTDSRDGRELVDHVERALMVTDRRLAKGEREALDALLASVPSRPVSEAWAVYDGGGQMQTVRQKERLAFESCRYEAGPLPNGYSVRRVAVVPVAATERREDGGDE